MLRDWTRRVLMVAIVAAMAALAGCVDINVGPDEEGAYLAKPEHEQVCRTQPER